MSNNIDVFNNNKNYITHTISYCLGRGSWKCALLIALHCCENSKWPPFLARQKVLENRDDLICRDTTRIKNFVKIALSSMVFEI